MVKPAVVCGFVLALVCTLQAQSRHQKEEPAGWPVDAAESGVWQSGAPATRFFPIRRLASIAPKAPSRSDKRRAFIKSLLIPGWGQYGLGARTSARHFFIAELALIGTSLGFRLYGNWLEDDFIAFALQHAEIRSAAGKDDRFWVDLGNFDSVDDFNAEKLRQRNTRDLRDPSGDEYWRWDAPENRRIFEDLRIRRDRAHERSAFIVAGIVANHIVSAIHALWIGKRLESRAAAHRPAFRFVWHSTDHYDGLQLDFFYRF